MNKHNYLRQYCFGVLIVALSFLVHTMSAQGILQTFGPGAGEFITEHPDGSFTLIAKYGETFYGIRTDANGNLAWKKVLPEPLTYIIPTAAGDGFVAVGAKNGFLYARKTDLDGNLIWERSGAADAWANHLQTTADGGYIITGSKTKVTTIESGGTVYSFSKYIVVLWKLNAAGEPVFYKEGNPGDANDNGAGQRVTQLSNGRFIVAGPRQSYAGSPSSNAASGQVFIFDQAGNLLFEKPTGILSMYLNAVVITDLKPTTDGGFVLSAYSGQLCHRCDGSAPHILKFDANGEVIWQSSGNRPTTAAYSVAALPGGAIFALATSAPEFGFIGDPAYIHRFDEEGHLVCRTYEPLAALDQQFFAPWFERYLIATRHGKLVIVGKDRNGNIFFYKNDETICPFGQGQYVDIELGLSSPTKSDPAIYTAFPVSISIKNTGTQASEGIKVHIPQPAGVTYVGGGEYDTDRGQFFPYGDETWQVGTLEAGATARLTVHYFLLTENPGLFYAQVVAQTGFDIDSQPGNGVCCAIHEDDELYLQFAIPSHLPDLLATNVTPLPVGTAGNVVSFFMDLVNAGQAIATGDFEIGFYLSNDPLLSPNDSLVGVIPTGNIPPGTIAAVPAAIAVPAGQAPGNYYILIEVDRMGVIYESNESNNLLAVPFNIMQIPADVDLAFGDVRFMPTQIAVGETFSHEISFFNQGTQASAPFKVGFYLSSDAQYHAGIDLPLLVFELLTLDPVPFASAVTSFRPITLPADLVPGTYHMLVVLDSEASIIESNESNNLLAFNFDVLPTGRPDLVLKRLVDLRTSMAAGTSFVFDVEYANLGQAVVRQDFVFRLYLSSDPYYDANDPVLLYSNFTDDIVVHAGFTRTYLTASIPPLTGSGNFYLLAVLDAFDQILELSEANNTLVYPVEIHAIAGVDLELAMSVHPVDPAVYSHFSITAVVTNRGRNAASNVNVHFPRPTGVVYRGGDEYSASQGDFQPYGHELWHVGLLAPGHSAILELRYFRLSGQEIIFFGEVATQQEADEDSFPDNGICCTPREDDEATVLLRARIGLRASGRTVDDERATGQVFQIMRAFPNPVTEVMSVIFVTTLAEEVNYTVYDADGRGVMEGRTSAIPGEVTTLTVKVDSLPEGLYTLLFQTGGYPASVRFVKILE